jgi:hypothetical protein
VPATIVAVLVLILGACAQPIGQPTQSPEATSPTDSDTQHRTVARGHVPLACNLAKSREADHHEPDVPHGRGRAHLRDGHRGGFGWRQAVQVVDQLGGAPARPGAVIRRQHHR